jgi:hypothetical protein
MSPCTQKGKEMKLKIEQLLDQLTELLLPGSAVCTESVAMGTDASGIVGRVFQIDKIVLDMSLANNEPDWTFTLDVIEDGKKVLMITLQYQHAWYFLGVRTKDMDTLRKFRSVENISWDVIAQEVDKAING